MPLPLSDMKRLEQYLSLDRLCLLPNSWLYVQIAYLEQSLDPLMGTDSIADIQALLNELDTIEDELVTQQSGSGLAQKINIVGEYEIEFQDGISTYSSVKAKKDRIIIKLCKILNISYSSISKGRTTRG